MKNHTLHQRWPLKEVVTENKIKNIIQKGIIQKKERKKSSYKKGLLKT